MTPVFPTLALVALVAAAPALAGDAPPSPPKAAPEEPMARVEQSVVRDVVQADASLVRSHEVVVQVYNALGVSAFGQIPTPYVDGYGEVTFDRVVIETSDGRRTEVTDGTVEDINPLGLSDSPYPADLRVKRLTVPGLAPGDRLSYRVTVREKPLYPERVFNSFDFEVDPLFSRQVYELDVPADLPLSFHRNARLGEWEELPSAKGRRVRRLTVAAPHDPAAEDDEAEDANEPDVLYTTFRSWDELARWWWAFSKDRFQPDDAVRTEAARVVAGLTDARARLDALYRFVGGQIRPLNVGFGSGRLQPMHAREVLAKRYADCKGKHALLAALGAASGVEVWPVLVSHHQSSLYDDAPSPDQFDHLISVVRTGPDPSQWTWIDATEAWAPLGLLSPSLRGKRGLLVDEKGGRLVDIPERPPFPTRRTVETTATLEAAGPLRAKVRWTLRGDLEPLVRATFRTMTTEQRQKLAQSMAAEWTKGEVGAISSGDPSDLSEPFWMEYEVVHRMTSQAFEKDWDLWLPLPDLELPEAKAVKEGPAVTLRDEDELVFRARAEIPEGMKARAPLSITLDRPFALYRSKYSVEGRTLLVERTLHVRQREIPADQAEAWEAFRRAVATDRSQQFPLEAFRVGNPAPADAGALNHAGNDALDHGDAGKAEELFRKAVEKDPRHKWAWNNLGRALRKRERPQEALDAFTRQIEVNPFDQYAYGNRGATLAFDLDRQEEGEKDLLKQIEVAPFEIDAYRELAYLRTIQIRFTDAAELLERAAAVKPTDREVWLKLAWARSRSGKGDVAEAARRARTLDDSPWLAIIGARALWAAGDLPGAAAVAREAAPRLFAQLEADDPPRFDDPARERYLLVVGEAWRLQGAAAFAAGDRAAAERYLSAAWELAGTPDGAVDLARLRQAQGRQDDAIAVLQQASFLPAWRANPAKLELERVVTDPERLKGLLENARREMSKRQILEVPGEASPAVVQIRLKLLADQRGRIVEVRPAQAADAAALEPLRARVLQTPLPAVDVDGATFRIVRAATVRCNEKQGCSLGLNFYGDEVATVLER